MVYLLGLALLGYAGVCGYMYLFQRRLIYHPDTQIGTPESYGLSGFGESFIRKGSSSLQLWVHPAQAGMPMVVYFHGNASHLGNRAKILGALAAKGFGVTALSYRGYGKSSGTPTETGLYDDARAAMAYVAQELGCPVGRTIIFGESLGTGVAVQMASEYPVGGLVLQAAYLSVAQRAAEMYPYIPVKWMIRDRFHSLNKIGKLTMPVLQFHGDRDDTIPLAHGRRLHEAVISPKEVIIFPGVGHADFDTARLAKYVSDFAHQYGLIDINAN